MKNQTLRERVGILEAQVKDLRALVAGLSLGIVAQALDRELDALAKLPRASAGKLV